MTNWQKTYEKVKEDLDLEAEDHDGLISQRKLEDIICTKIGKDKVRTIPNTITQLRCAHVIEPMNQFSYRYMMNGWKEKWKDRKVQTDKERVEQILGARVL